MAMIQGTGYNPAMSMLSMVVNGQNKNGLNLQDISQTNVSTNTTDILSQLQSYTGKTSTGWVETTSYPTTGYSNAGVQRLPSYTEDTVQHDYLTKTAGTMTERQFEAAIKKLAEKNAANGVYEDVGEDYFELARAYVSTVSPDRKTIIDDASSTTYVATKVNYDVASAYDDSGQVVATYNPTKGWTNKFTKEEKARNTQFDTLYWDAYNAYVKANNLDAAGNSSKVEGAVANDEEKPSTVDVTA